MKYIVQQQKPWYLNLVFKMTHASAIMTGVCLEGLQTKSVAARLYNKL